VFHSTTRPANPGSVGRPFPTVTVEIRDDDGAALSPGEEGHVFIASPMLFSGYVGEARAADWVSAGDRGYLDEDGCLHLTGRANRMIKSKGLKIHPEPIEAALIALPEVQQAAVVALPDPVRGAVPVAVVEFAAGRRLDRRALAAHCRATLNVRHTPQRYFLAARLPLTRTGKLAFTEIRDSLLSESGAYTELP